MKFTAIFLTGAALAQRAHVITQNGHRQVVSNVPGECTPLIETIKAQAYTTHDIGLKFYTGHNCDGEQVATHIGRLFKPTGDLSNVKSVKTVARRELNN